MMKSSVDYLNQASRGDLSPLGDEGGEWEFLPAQLCTDLTLLILEGRQPDPSVKGRKEGEHCPPAKGTMMHYCQASKELCAQITSVNAYISFLCRNDIPVSVEVLLYPDCCHGNQKRVEVGASAEGGREQVPGLQEYVVLEQWIIQVLPKRFPDGYSHFHVLMQAVRSFLHFSQLSAWLSYTQGRAPQNIVYRVCAHGESFAENTRFQPELHTFPFLNISKSSSLQVSVASLPRQTSIPQPACYSLLHNKGLCGKAKTKVRSECQIGQSYSCEDEEVDRRSGYRADCRFDHTHGVHERTEPYERRGCETRYQKETDFKATAHRQFPGVVDRDARRGSLEQECTFEAIQQKKAQVRNSNKLRDSPKLFRPFPSNLRTENTQSQSESEQFPQFPLQSKGESTEDLFTSLTPFWSGEIQQTSAPIHDIVCENVKKEASTKYHEQLVELEEGLSLLKLHHIPATPCHVYYTPERESVDSRSTSLGSTDSDQGISFTALPTADVFEPEWDRFEEAEDGNRDIFLTEQDECDANSSRDESFVCRTAGLRDWSDSVHDDSYRVDACSEATTSAIQLTEDSSISGSPGLGYHSKKFGSACSLVCHEVCHQPTADLCYIPSDGARVSAEECAARRRHVSGNSQDGMLDHGKSPSCETLTNQSAIISGNGGNESQSQCFNAAVFKSKSESGSVKSSPSASPMASPRRAHKPRGWDDFKPDIPAPFSSGVGPHQAHQAQEEKENKAEGAFPFPPKGKSLLRNVLSKSHQVEEATTEIGRAVPKESCAKASMRRSLDGSSTYVFHPRTGLPINSSPAPLRKTKTTNDCPSLLKPIGLTSSPSCNNLEKPSSMLLSGHPMRMLSTSAPATSCLLGNFEESVLNGRLEPLGTIDGFTAQIGASGAFCPKHICLPVTTFFYSVCDDDAPSSYFGHINLEGLGRRGYQVPKCGTIQVTLFNPNKSVVKMFVVRYDLADMPPNCQTFARQRIFYMPSDVDIYDECDKELRYLIHLRFQTSKSGKVYLHTDIRMIFARHSPDLESSFGTFELRSFTEIPTNPRFSPKK